MKTNITNWVSSLMVVVSMVHGTTLMSQDINDFKVDSIQHILKQDVDRDSLKSYYKTLNALEKYYVDNQMYDSIYSVESYYLHKPQTRLDSLAHRQQLTRHAYNLKNQLGEIYAAKDFFLKASQYVADPDTLDSWVPYVEYQLAISYAKLNDYDKALYYYLKCGKRYDLLNQKVALGRLMIDLGEAYLFIGDTTNMHSSYLRGIEISKEVDDPRIMQGINANLAEFYIGDDESSNDLNKALGHVKVSESYLSSLLDDRNYLSRLANLNSLQGAICQQQKKYDEGINFYEKAIANFQEQSSSKINRSIAKLYLNIAECHLESNSISETHQAITRGFNSILSDTIVYGIPKTWQISNENTFVDLLGLKAKCYDQQYGSTNKITYLDSIFECLDLAIYANEKLDDELVLNNSKYLSSAVNKNLLEAGLKAAYEGISVDPAKAMYKVKARTYFDYSKGQILLQKIKENQLVKNLPIKERRRISKLKSENIKLLSSPNANTKKDSIQSQITKNESEIKELLDAQNISKPTSQLITTPYIEYCETQDDIYLFTNIGEINFYKLTSTNELKLKISLLNQTLLSKNQDELDHCAEQLYSMLVPIDISKLSELTIIPDGILCTVPFDVLRYDDTYLIETLNTSVQFTNYNMQREQFANSDLSLSIIRPSYPIMQVPDYLYASRSDIYHLPFALKESEVLQKMFANTSKIDSIMPAQAFKQELERYDILHFTGHALVDKEQAYLVFNVQDTIQKLYDNQIAMMTNDAEMVCLSACETGLGTFKPGEGMKSIANAFMMAGTNSVVYTLWKVNDQSSSQIIKQFYHYLKKGNTKDQALRQAKLDYLLTAPPGLRHPYYWAGFVVAGDTSSLFDQPTYYWQYSLGIIAIFFISFLYVKTKTT